MATNTLIMSYVLRKFKNARSSANNRWFAYVNRVGTLSTRGLAQHMIEHGQLYQTRHENLPDVHKDCPCFDAQQEYRDI